MKMVFHVVALVGLITLGIDVYWLVILDHHYRQYIALVVSALLLIDGLLCRETQDADNDLAERTVMVLLIP